MNAPAFLEAARRIDADIQALDRRRLLATVNHAPRPTLAKMDAQRNALVKQWGAMWQTRPVSQP